jgi:hypothetical protein
MSKHMCGAAFSLPLKATTFSTAVSLLSTKGLFCGKFNITAGFVALLQGVLRDFKSPSFLRWFRRAPIRLWTHDGDSAESRSAALRLVEDSDAIRAEILTSDDVSMSQQLASLLLPVIRRRLTTRFSRAPYLIRIKYLDSFDTRRIRAKVGVDLCSRR